MIRSISTFFIEHNDKIKNLALWAFHIFLGLRLYAFTSQYALFIPVSDQWGYYAPIVFERGLLQGFFTQVGSHFLGLSYVISWSVSQLSSHWVWAEGLFMILCLMLVSALTLNFKKRLTGDLHFFDILIPWVFINSYFYEVLLWLAHSSNSSMPLLFIYAYSRVLLMPSALNRQIWSFVLFFFALFSGYAFLVSVVIMGMGVLRCFQNPRDRSQYFLLPLYLLSLGLFYYLYQPMIQEACKNILNLQDYLAYATQLIFHFFRFFEIRKLYFIMLFLGISVPIGYALIVHGKSIKGKRILLALASFSVLYIILNTLARTCSGIEIALSPRYSLFLLPLFASLYLIIVQLSGSKKIKLVMKYLFIAFGFKFVSKPLDSYYPAVYQKIDELKALENCIIEQGSYKACAEQSNQEIVSKKFEPLAEEYLMIWFEKQGKK